jgi:hypothetical protein
MKNNLIMLLIVIAIAGTCLYFNNQTEITEISGELAQSEKQIIKLKTELINKDSSLVLAKEDSESLKEMASIQLSELECKLNEARILLSKKPSIITKTDTIISIIKDTIEVVKVMEMQADTIVTIIQKSKNAEVISDIALRFYAALLLDSGNNLYWDHNLDVRIEKTKFNISFDDKQSGWIPNICSYVLKDTDSRGFNAGLGAGIRRRQLSAKLMFGIRGGKESFLQAGGMISYEFTRR